MSADMIIGLLGFHLVIGVIVFLLMANPSSAGLSFPRSIAYGMFWEVFLVIEIVKGFYLNVLAAFGKK